MKRNYIVFDTVTRKVVYESNNEQCARNYIDNHNEDVLYMITLCIMGNNVIYLNGCMY